MTKKILAMIMAVSMAVASMVGCSGPAETGSKASASTATGTSSVAEGTTNAESKATESTPQGDANLNMEGYPIVKDKITVSLMGSKASIQGPWDQLKLFKIMEEKTNIAFKFDTPMADVYNEKKNLAFVSGDYPNVFLGGNLTFQEEAKYGEAGILIPLENLIEKYAPAVTKMFKENPEVKKSVTAPDGHIYALPQINKCYGAGVGLWYNEKWLTALGIKEIPTTAEENREILMRFKNEDPNGNGEADEIPLSGWGKGGVLMNQFLPAFGMYGTHTNAFYVKNDKIHYTYIDDNYPEFIKFINGMWKDGLIDKEIFTQGQSEMIAKAKDNQIGLVDISVPQLAYDIPDLNDAAKYPVLPAMSSKISTERAISGNDGITRGVFAITSSCENPEAMMRWADYLYTEEGSMLVHFGEENDLFKYLPDGRKQYIMPADGRSTEEYRGGVITPDCGTALPKWVREENEAKWDDPFQEIRLNTIKSQLEFAHTPLPSMYLTPDEQKVVDAVFTDLDKYVKSMEAKFYVGEESIDNFDAFKETINKIGVEDVISAYQAAYDRWKNS